MAYTVQSKIVGDSLEVTVAGERVKSRAGGDAVRVWKQVTEKAKSEGLKNILFHIQLTGDMSYSDSLTIAQSFEINQWDTDCKLAIVLADHTQLPKHQLVKSMVDSKGFQVQYFPDVNDARTWLATN